MTKPSKSIKIKLTPRQMAVLAPLHEKAQKHPGTGMVLAQIFSDRIASCRFITPKQLRASLDEMVINSCRFMTPNQVRARLDKMESKLISIALKTKG